MRLPGELRLSDMIHPDPTPNPFHIKGTVGTDCYPSYPGPWVGLRVKMEFSCQRQTLYIVPSVTDVIKVGRRAWKTTDA
jgi:hypothetical protein